jgi:hypothetical protein
MLRCSTFRARLVVERLDLVLDALDRGGQLLRLLQLKQQCEDSCSRLADVGGSGHRRGRRGQRPSGRAAGPMGLTECSHNMSDETPPNLYTPMSHYHRA